jgi:C_GCAxxG_C_C family probable redox protein
MDELPDACVRMANGFGGGVGGSHLEICGALGGAVMVIGGLYGRTEAQQNDQRSQQLCARYRRAFLDEFGVTTCGPLRDWVNAPGGPGTCAAVVERAARRLLALLDAADSPPACQEGST